VTKILLPLKSAKSRAIQRKFDLIAVQGHPRSSTRVTDLGKNQKRLCKLSLVTDTILSRAVFEIMRH